MGDNDRHCQVSPGQLAAAWQTNQRFGRLRIEARRMCQCRSGASQ